MILSIESLFYPRGVVVYGSMAEGKMGNVFAGRLLEGGYKDVFAVNPKGQGCGTAVSGYTSALEVGTPLDLAVIASPAATVSQVLADCGEAGVKAAVVITSGFSEAGNSAGEAEVIETARRYGIRFVGPNCAGIINSGHNLYPTMETAPPKGETALVSQSGALGGAILSWAEEQGLGFSKFVSYGNGADLNEVDFINYLASDPDTKVLALYVESVRDGRSFMEAVDRFTRLKPLVVIKSGRTGSGQRAALSHTGSMAGSDQIFESAIVECGAVRVKDVEEMFDLCKSFTYMPPVKGRKTIIVTNSGGPGVLSADMAEEIGLNIAELSTNQRETLSGFLPPHCGMRNPVDLTVEGTEEGYYKTLINLLVDYDAAVAINVGTPTLDSTPLAKGVCRAFQESGKPVLVNFMAGKTVDYCLPYLESCGLPNYATGERAVKALGFMADYYERNQQRRSLLTVKENAQVLPGEGQMLEHEAMAWLKSNGISTPPFIFASNSEEVVQASREIGYPVVMKVVSPKIIHKSEFGGVVVNIKDNTEATAAFKKIKQNASGMDFRGVLIYPMVSGAQEVLVGLSRDPEFGPVVVFGLGGIHTELWKDIAMRVAPVDFEGAMAMIRSIKSYPLLSGFRNTEPVDLTALADLLAKFSRLPFIYPEIEEVDLNPVFCFADRVLVGDVRVIRKNNKDL
jgi:acetate---CoA ligase (ADP-forming)